MPRVINLNDSLENLYGVGPKFAERLGKFSIKTVMDLLWHFPFRYEDFSNISKIGDLKIGQHAVIRGEIVSVKMWKSWKKRMFVIEALVSDGSGSIRAVWFNQRFLITVIKKGITVNLAGKIIETKGGLTISHPIHEIITSLKKDAGDLRHTGRIVPVYPETRGLTSKMLRFLIQPLLKNIGSLEDPLPEEILKSSNLPDLETSLQAIHFPETLRQAQAAQKRFAFEDLFFLQLVNFRQRLRLAREKAYSAEIDLEEIKEMLKKLPFELTRSQKKSLWEILRDLKKSHPMNRLLQGDVGSGKTIVAILAALSIIKDNKQVAFMVPTEVLAQQHYNTFKKIFSGFNKGAGIITSSIAKVFYGDGLESDIKKSEIIKKIKNGEIKIVFGTHSLIQKYIKFSSLAFAVIDEQHRFGVRQRADLLKNNKSGIEIPHLLSMSATPIPRTLTLTVFGDLDLSIIDELPKGRKEIITKIVSPLNRDKAYAFIRDQVKKGRQIFVICPRIDADSSANLPDGTGRSSAPAADDDLDSRATDFSLSLGDQARWRSETFRAADWRSEIKAVKEEYEKLSQKIFPDLKVAMLHGKMKAKEKTEIMKKFKDGEIDILVSTSVVEVGVDVPNATIMMIEGSDKFGLAQLYQFRGRVGRGEHQSFCFLFTDSSSQTTRKRLHSLIEAKNGFELAEKDLAIRGPGEFLGESQTGIPDLAMKAVQNPELVKSGREAAEMILKKDPELKNYPLLKKRLDSFEKKVHLE
ncbi:MAG: ATP-dependent DNA helicase RecG [bacterium]|nr:ATP-dependent DNA helicase RecG [bacterium]